MTANPYTARMGFADPRLFVGRDAESAQVAALLDAPKPASVEILGPSRIGKTSLLQQVGMEIGRRTDPAVPCATVPPVVVKDKDSAFRALAKALAQAISPKQPVDSAAFGLGTFPDWLRETLGDSRALLFLDDFDDWSFPCDEIRFQMYGVLRAALWQQRLGICLTTRHRVQELCSPGGQTRALLWNVFSTVELGLLTRADVKDLIYRPHAEAGLAVTDEEWELVFAEAGPHPCLTQIAGYHLFEAKQKTKGRLSPEDLYYLHQRVHREIAAHFPVFLDHVKARDENLVAAARHLAAHQPISRDDGVQLIQLGMAYSTARGPRLLSEAFERFLAETVKPPVAAPAAEHRTAPKAQLEKRGARVFLCHASADRAFAERLCHDLFDAGIDVWVDWLSITPGELYDRAIEEALFASSHVLLAVSPNALSSSYVRSEVEWALDNRLTVIPIIHRAVRLPPRWHGLNNCDATTEVLYQQTVVRLVAVLPRR